MLRPQVSLTSIFRECGCRWPYPLRVSGEHPRVPGGVLNQAKYALDIANKRRPRRCRRVSSVVKISSGPWPVISSWRCTSLNRSITRRGSESFPRSNRAEPSLHCHFLLNQSIGPADGLASDDTIEVVITIDSISCCDQKEALTAAPATPIPETNRIHRRLSVTSRRLTALVRHLGPRHGCCPESNDPHLRLPGHGPRRSLRPRLDARRGGTSSSRPASPTVPSTTWEPTPGSAAATSRSSHGQAWT